MIDEGSIEKALDFLRDTADEYGNLVGEAIGAEKKISIVEAIEFDKIEKGGEQTKKMKARATQAYQDAVDEYRDVEAKLISLKCHRETAQSKISWAQSLLRSKQQGVTL